MHNYQGTLPAMRLSIIRRSTILTGKEISNRSINFSFMLAFIKRRNLSKILSSAFIKYSSYVNYSRRYNSFPKNRLSYLTQLFSSIKFHFPDSIFW